MASRGFLSGLGTGKWVGDGGGGGGGVGHFLVSVTQHPAVL